ncbi:MAG TPA: hypothetical protein VH206_15770 [Xanthobacteraceae bacterium]|jgi:hypothetical protein|nr:hypothetical protein [Xanthobacteraceae bacterium]
MNVADLKKLAKESAVLAGSSAGRRMCNLLLESAKASQPGLFLLDASGVDVATSSFMREAIVEFRNLVRRDMPDIYPVLTGLKPDVEEELVGLLNQIGEAFWLFEISKRIIKKHRLIGRIDPKLKETLELIERGHGYDAATLWKSTNSTESVGVTAWNNRLANLSRQGLVFESRVGKQKYFHPLHNFQD